MFNAIDSVIDGVTMYRLMLYYLGGLLLAAIGLAVVGDLQYSPVYLTISTLILLAACWGINRLFAAIFDAPSNPESSLITALILALIMPPNPTGFGFTFLLAAAGLAIASKYLLTINRKHIFNPAAVAVALTALGPRQSASWWIGTAVMLPFVLIGGVLVMRKIRRERMVLSFLAATTIATAIYSLFSGSNVVTGLTNMVLSSPIFFLGFVMLTEPITSPTTQTNQVWYGSLVGLLLPPQVHILNFYSSPELALVAGNVFSYIVSPKFKLFPILKQRLTIANSTSDFVFTPSQHINYRPGQYIEWTLPHQGVDSRGSRRYFTLASSPTEATLRIGVKFYNPSSSFKRALLSLRSDTPITASQLAGDFVMPEDASKKLVFLAGGIGVTPFRSMIKYLIDTEEARDIAMLYSARTANDVAYRDIFEQARTILSIPTTYVLADEQNSTAMPYTVSGIITADLIRQTVPDYLERVFYISGTHPMVMAMQENLTRLGVSRRNIKIDFFPGYA